MKVMRDEMQCSRASGTVGSEARKGVRISFEGQVPLLLPVFLAVFYCLGCATRGPSIIDEVQQSHFPSVRNRWAGFASREESDPVLEGKLALADALKLALRYNKELQIAYEEREVAAGRVLESYGQALPHLSANAAYTRLDSVPEIEVGREKISLGFEDNYSVELTVRQPVFHGGAIPAALRAARLYTLWSDATIQGAVQGLLFQTTKAYYDWLLAQQLALADERSLEFVQALLEDVKRKRASGLVSEYDVLRAEVELSNTRAQQIRSQNSLELARTTLLKSLGVSLRSCVEPADELCHAPLSLSREEALRTALEQRPELFQAEYALRMQREAVRAARSAYSPKLDFFFNHKWANPDPHSSTRDEWGDAWTVGLAMSLSIFDGFERRGKLVQERARLTQAELRLRSQEETVAFEVEQALLNLRNAEELVESQRKNLGRAEEGLRLAQAGYRQGVQNELAVLDARTALSRARTLYYEALYAHMLARLGVQRAMGTLTINWDAVAARKNPEAAGGQNNLSEKDERE
ncbi:MAG: TolC family protein [Kiritimatiellia bacterium]